ncbi:Uncharacterised protein [Mycobacteroides abscessus subsp. bolletii]|nr:Uncharacterised protein [Mycobacteroides abscessus subsp. bolletii]
MAGGRTARTPTRQPGSSPLLSDPAAAEVTYEERLELRELLDALETRTDQVHRARRMVTALDTGVFEPRATWSSGINGLVSG